MEAEGVIFRTGMDVDGGGGVGGERNRMRFSQRGDLHESGDPPAPRRVRLQYIHRSRLEHPAEIEDVIAVLACRDVHARRRPVDEERQPFKVVRGDGLFEPGHSLRRKPLGLRQRQLPRVRPVRVDKQLGVRSDRVACGGNALHVGSSSPRLNQKFLVALGSVPACRWPRSSS